MAGKILGNLQQPELVAFLAHGNFFAGTHLVGRNVDLLAIDLHVTVADQLTGLAPRYGKAEAVDHVIEAALQLLQQYLAGDASGAGGAFKVVAELFFLSKVDALRLLFLAKLQPVADDFGLAVLAVLAGSEITLFDRTFIGEALCAFEEQFHALAAAKAAYCVFVPCQVTFSLTGRACPPLYRSVYGRLASLRPGQLLGLVASG